MNKYKVTLTVLSPDNKEAVQETCNDLLVPLQTPENITVEKVEVEVAG